MPKVTVRKGMPGVQLSKEEFARRFREKFYDPAFAALDGEIDRVVDLAWEAYDDYRRTPRTRRAGREFADPGFELAREWLETRRQIRKAESGQRNRRSPSRVLLINGSPRSDQTCPGEMSKSYRLALLAQEILEKKKGFEVELLDLSRLTSEYGRVIFPCKACVSTAMPLCHWPCSCYPNHAMGQVNDWMAEIYPKWVAAHGVMIVSPVHWHHAPSTLKLMIDRLVCADGGNPDPTTTGGKDPKRAKQLELQGWPYPRHLAGRAFSVVVHGDAEGVDGLRRSLSDWLSGMGLIPAGRKALLGAYVGYLEPYATSHGELDRDSAFQEEVRNAARALAHAVEMLRRGQLVSPDAIVPDVRPK